MGELDRIKAVAGADIIGVYGNHMNSADMGEHTAVLEKLVDYLRGNMPADMALIFVDENLPWPADLDKPGFGQPQWSRWGPLRILEDERPHVRNGLRAIYKQVVEKQRRDYRVTFGQRMPQKGLYFRRMRETFKKKPLWDFLLREHLRVIPEPMDFETWLVSLRAYFHYRISAGALDRGDLDEALRSAYAGSAATAEAVRRRDKRLAAWAKEEKKKLPRVKVITMRGGLHRFGTRMYGEDGLTHGGLITAGHEAENLPLSERIVLRHLLGQSIGNEERISQYVRSFVQASLMEGYVARFGGVPSWQASIASRRILSGMGAEIPDWEAWLRQALARGVPGQDAVAKIQQAVVSQHFAIAGEILAAGKPSGNKDIGIFLRRRLLGGPEPLEEWSLSPVGLFGSAL